MSKHGKSGPDLNIGKPAKTGPTKVSRKDASELPPRRCVIYAIVHNASGKRYVGSTVDCLDRWKHHRSRLNKNIHHCSHLQRSWNKYGKEAFSFVVLETLPDNDSKLRRIAELKWLSLSKPFNALVNGQGLEFFAASPEVRARMSAAQIKVMLDENVRKAKIKRGKEMAAAIRTPAGRKRAGAITKRRWQDPDERKKLMQGLINRWAAPGARKRQSEAL